MVFLVPLIDKSFNFPSVFLLSWKNYHENRIIFDLKIRFPLVKKSCLKTNTFFYLFNNHDKGNDKLRMILTDHAVNCFLINIKHFHSYL